MRCNFNIYNYRRPQALVRSEITPKFGFEIWSLNHYHNALNLTLSAKVPVVTIFQFQIFSGTRNANKII